MDISAVNTLTCSEFKDYFQNVVEKHIKCSQFLCAKRPFPNLKSVIKLAHEYLDSLINSDVQEILCLHPDLAGKIADDSNLTSESQQEQRAAGLRNISACNTEELQNLNNLYKAKFGFPFIICARDNKFIAILTGLKTRLENTRNEEIQTALEEVKKIASYRIRDLIIEDEPNI